MPNIVVLGSGMAGFGAAYRFHAEGITPVIYEENAYHGGHTASFRYDSGFLFDVGPHISFTKDPRIQDLFAESVDQQYETVQIILNNYLARILAPASCSTSPSRTPRRRHRQGHHGFRGGAPRTGTAGEELRRLVAVEFRPDLRRALSHAIHAKVPPHHRRQHEHRLAGAAHLPAEPGGGSARCAIAILSARSLHHELPLPDRRGIRILPEEIRPIGRAETQSRDGVARSPCAADSVLERHSDALRRVGLFGTAAGSRPHDTRRAAGRSGGVKAFGLFDMRTRERRRGPRRPFHAPICPISTTRTSASRASVFRTCFPHGTFLQAREASRRKCISPTSTNP